MGEDKPRGVQRFNNKRCCRACNSGYLLFISQSHAKPLGQFVRGVTQSDGNYKILLFHILWRLYIYQFIKVRKLLIAIPALIFALSEFERKGERENR